MSARPSWAGILGQVRSDPEAASEGIAPPVKHQWKARVDFVDSSFIHAAERLIAGD
jgi:hypothetical protein